MALSLAAAALGSALIGGGASIYAADQASSANKKQLEAQQQAQAQQAALIQQYLAPYASAGSSALDALLAQLGIGGTTGGGQDWDAYLQQNPDAAAWVQSKIAAGSNMTPEQLAEQHWELDGARRDVPTTPVQQVAQRPDPVAPTDVGAGADPYAFGPITAPGAYGSFIDNPNGYEASPEYDVKQSRINEAVNAGYAAKGLLRSGAALKALTDRSGEAVNLDYDNWAQRQLDIYNANRATWAANAGQYNINRQTVLGQFNADRTYDADAYDTKFDNLLKIAGLGQSAGSSIASGVNQTTQASANAQSQYYAAQGQNSADLATSLGGTLQNLLRLTSSGSANPVISNLNPASAIDYSGVSKTPTYYPTNLVANPTYRFS